MSQGTYGEQSTYDRNEMFAIGAAAGALIATAIQEMIERRRKTPLERATERASNLVSAGSQKISGLQETAVDYVADLSKQSRKATRKQAKKARKQASTLKDVATGALSAVAVSNLVDNKRERSEDAWLDGDKKSGGWFRKGRSGTQAQSNGAGEAVEGASTSASRWWRRASSPVQEQVEAARATIQDSATEQSGAGARGVLENLSQALLQYLESARETVVQAELGTKARGAATTARGRIEDAKLRDKARTYASTAGETLKEAAETARERLAEAEIGGKAREYAQVAAGTTKEYSAKAGKAAKVSAEKLGASAAHVAESTSEGAKDLRKGVKKQVKRTRRRINWGLRAFIIGLVVGLLSAPQSGQRTRGMAQGFIENLLDIFLPDDQAGQGTTI